MINKYNIHRKESKRLFDNEKTKLFYVGQHVLLKNKPKFFKKINSVFNPDFRQQTFTIKKIFRDKLPYKYSTEELGDKRFFYSHQMQPLDKLFGTIKTNNNEISVLDVEIEQTSRYLRSGKTPIEKQSVLYKINQNDKQSLMTSEQLHNLIKIFGKGSVKYSQNFYTSPEKQKYIL